VSKRTRLALFVVLAVGCVAVAVIAVVSGAQKNGDPATKASAGADKALTTARVDNRQMVVYRALGTGKAKDVSDMDLTAVAGPEKTVTRSGLACARVYFAGGRGLCVARGHGLTSTFQADIFGPDLKVARTVGLTGIPSRARVSPDGRYGAVTMFVAGHAYATPGSFSTQTTLINLATGSKIADLEDFTVANGERQVTAVDVNFWGVTFARDSDRFYATLATGGKTYLIEGSVSAKTAHVIHTNVECPSLSPDGTRIAYKKRTGPKSDPWRLTVLDLATKRETPLAEPRSVDDQVEWLDDGHVLYAVDGAVWTAPADGTGKPRRFLASAESPAVVRW
jgi:hypothetical protein